MDAAEQQKRTEAQRISEALRDLMNVYRSRFEEEFHAGGITLPQLRLLKAVQGQTERSAASIARECHVAPQTLHTMLARAVREGWITRGSTERNGRFVTANLTPAGEALLNQGTRLKEQVEFEMWRNVPLKAVQQVRSLLETGVANLQRPGVALDTAMTPQSKPHPRA